VIVISVIIKEELGRVTAIASLGLGLILLVPIIDSIIGKGYLITCPLRLKPYLINFLNPLVSITKIGVSPGQRIVIILISILVAFYAYLKRQKLAISLLLLLITLGIIIFWGGLPAILAGNRPENIYLSGGILDSDEQKFAAIFVLLFIFSFFLYYHLLNKKHFRVLVNSLRIERIFFYSGIGGFGFIFSVHQKNITQLSNVFDPVAITLLILSLAFGFQGAQVINDFFDIETDRITRQRNPLLKGMNNPPKADYLTWGLCLIILSLSLALIINYPCFLLMLSYLLLSVIYSVPPVRLKRIPLVSTFILAVAVILAMAMGFSLLYEDRALSVMPKVILIPTLLAITFGFIAKDIQDLKGDRNTGVITLPVLLYPPKADTKFGRLPIAILVGISYLFYIIFIPKVLVGAIICSLLTILYTIFIRNIKEWFYFILLYIFGLYLLLILLRIPS
jgi:4-hydroxybenzoate polyprenyltransferase